VSQDGTQQHAIVLQPKVKQRFDISPALYQLSYAAAAATCCYLSHHPKAKHPVKCLCLAQGHNKRTCQLDPLMLNVRRVMKNQLLSLWV